MCKSSLIIILFLSTILFAADEEAMYVQTLKTDLKTNNRMNAETVAQLKRGEKVSVITKEGIWFKVRSKDAKVGWVSRLFLSSHVPIGQADISQDIPTTLEKASRRRAPSYAVSASARGLMMGDRARHGRELYETDFDALERLEKFEISPRALDNFNSSGKLK